MLRSQSKCTQNVIGGYIGGKMIRSPQFTQDVPTGFQVTSPPVLVAELSTRVTEMDISHGLIRDYMRRRPLSPVD